MDFKKLIKKITLGLMALTISMPIYSHASELDPDAIYEQYYKNNPYVYEYTGPGEHGFQFVIPGNHKVTNYGSVIKTNPNSYQTYVPDQRITLNTPKTIKSLTFGQHYYIPKTGGEDGIIPIAYYKCAYPFGKCIHGSGYDTSTVGKYHWMGIHDLPSAPGQRTCARRYDSGWIAICANCGKEIPCLIYGTSDALKTVPYLFTGYGMTYPNSLVYTCPWDGKSIEQGWGISHSCSRISQNRYFIKYDLGNDTAGTATKSTHYYGKDVKSYEGVAVTDLDNIYNLTPQKPGYIFKGWTSVKGSGTPVDGTSDKITANWTSDGIILPGVKKDNAVFDKWVDEDGNDIGGESEYFIPTKIITVKPKFINYDKNGHPYTVSVFTENMFLFSPRRYDKIVDGAVALRKQGGDANGYLQRYVYIYISLTSTDNLGHQNHYYKEITAPI